MLDGARAPNLLLSPSPGPQETRGGLSYWSVRPWYRGDHVGDGSLSRARLNSFLSIFQGRQKTTPSHGPSLENNFIPSTASYAVIPKTRLPGTPLVRPEATRRQIVEKHREISLSKVPGQQNRKNLEKSTSLKASPMVPCGPTVRLWADFGGARRCKVGVCAAHQTEAAYGQRSSSFA